jgi:membrane protein YqaA with SNARE-associated domain
VLGAFRRLYDWVLHWAKTPFAVSALFLLAFAESSFFPIPPDVLLLAMGLSLPLKVFRFAAICTLGSVLGGMAGYGIGYGLWELSSTWFYQWVPGFTQDGFNSIQALFKQYNFWLVFAAGFTPIPYKIITIGAGVFDITFPIFVIASAVSRGMRFYLIALIVYRYGDQARKIIDKNFNVITSLFALLLIGGFLVVRYIF